MHTHSFLDDLISLFDFAAMNWIHEFFHAY